MPGLDGTGPAGMGPMTGRGLGWCRYGAGYGPYAVSPWYRRPFGFWPGWGRGFGWRRGWGFGMQFRRGWGWRGGPRAGFWW
ncbi:DUF5320 domain-containing protein [Thermotoga sp. KOL6]|uniref:DUF5320 domain-containing protein n=1 Tax=Thermotoga sp. KOL6 TaxID=126741 RepID=UPI000C76003D|nr:DUF5320 domain-containing protein [Thermotoga sp. KOL6]PLV59084.1 hypothetical protein AS005_04825 [Thermotoga sp. KOL6]